MYHFRITAAFIDHHSRRSKYFILSGEPAGIRTQDPRLKRALLYLLSYELVQGRSLQIITGRLLLHRYHPSEPRFPVSVTRYQEVPSGSVKPHFSQK